VRGRAAIWLGTAMILFGLACLALFGYLVVTAL